MEKAGEQILWAIRGGSLYSLAYETSHKPAMLLQRPKPWRFSVPYRPVLRLVDLLVLPSSDKDRVSLDASNQQPSARILFFITSIIFCSCETRPITETERQREMRKEEEEEEAN